MFGWPRGDLLFDVREAVGMTAFAFFVDLVPGIRGSLFVPVAEHVPLSPLPSRTGHV